ncbi:MAG: adenylosuccinate synthetase [Candidatus Pacebacteria bacterium]|nr:adenylosuccinate synthetase [Candidatus Paceibacterota bacterium]
MDKYLEKYYGSLVSANGFQFGSEGKGAIVEYLAPITSAAVRIGAPNAGHTVYYNGLPYVMRQIPCAWINPYAKLIIGISAVISLPILQSEIEKINKILPIKHRLYVDPRAIVITDDQIAREMSTGLADRISSTSAKAGLGIGMAMSDKVLRSEHCLFAKDVPELQQYMCDTADLINDMLEHDEIVALEGSQGFGLSLEHGYFPFVTSRDTTTMALFAGVGVNPYVFHTEVIGVVRTFPIRVGGPSGIFDSDSKEVSWNYVKRFSGSKNDLTERTSVTNSIRRVATFSWQGFDRACMINRPSEIALTFADYLDARAYNQENLSKFPKIENFIEILEHHSGVPVGLVKTGPQIMIDRDTYRRSMMRKMCY